MQVINHSLSTAHKHSPPSSLPKSTQQPNRHNLWKVLFSLKAASKDRALAVTMNYSLPVLHYDDPGRNQAAHG